MLTDTPAGKMPHAFSGDDSERHAEPVDMAIRDGEQVTWPHEYRVGVPRELGARRADRVNHAL